MTGNGPERFDHGTAAAAMLRAPRTEPPRCTVADARAVFEDDHVHALLVVDGDRLLSVVQRTDLVDVAPETAAADVGRLGDRTIHPDAALEPLRRQMVATGTRRLAVVDGGRLLGLLCLKSSGTGFCSDEGVAARAAERAAPGERGPQTTRSTVTC